MNYRKDISGLRAVAVVLVLLFHGKLALFPSGFIGVDIFFVISGFLITSIIQSQLDRGTFSLADFYVRRLWRIQVALLVVVFVTLLLALALYLPLDLKSYLKSAIDTVGFVSNRYFAHATTAYAAPDSEVLLLLHTWSLSIEWQWYLILPLWLMLLHRFASPRQGKAIVVLAAFVMAAAALLITRKEGSDAYYFFTPRVFEFLFGAGLALLTLRRAAPAETWMTNVGGMAALLVLLALAMSHGVIADYPNAYAVVVCAACIGVLGVGANERTWVARGLSSAVPVFLGDISYSLYLWHWPIFATARYLGMPEGVALLLVCYALTLACAYLSYRYIEEPYRKRHPGLVKSLVVLVLIPLLVVSSVYAVSDKLQFLPARFGSEMVSIGAKLARYTPKDRQPCMQSGAGPVAGIDRCALGDTRATVQALMIGDSYSNQSWKFIDVLARDAHVSVTAVSTPSCLVFPHITMQGWWKMNSGQYQPCINHVGDYYGLIQSHHYTYVIIGENWLYYDADAIVNDAGDARSVQQGHERLEQAVRRGLDLIIKTGAIPVMLESPMPMPDNFQVCFYRHIKWRTAKPDDACPVSKVVDPDMQWFQGMFARLKASYPSLVLIDPKDAQCVGRRCVVEIDGVPLYRDVGHLTDYASYRLGEIYLQQKPNPFKPSPTQPAMH
jgi:peptidoglycan/LPS O-acetylase OafA/YrhL